MSVLKTIEQKLNKNLNIENLEVIDESDLHQGHAGWNEAGESHFRIKIVSSDFLGKSRVNQHKMIYKILEEDLKKQIHALAIESKPIKM